MRRDTVRWLPHDLPTRAHDAATWRKLLVGRTWWVTPDATDASMPAAWMRELHAALEHLEATEHALARSVVTAVTFSRATIVGLSTLGLAALLALGVAIEANAYGWIRAVAGGTVLLPLGALLVRGRRMRRARAIRAKEHAAALRDMEAAVAALLKTSWVLRTGAGLVGYRPLGTLTVPDAQEPTREDGAIAPLTPVQEADAGLRLGATGSAPSADGGPGLDGVAPLPAPWDVDNGPT